MRSLRILRFRILTHSTPQLALSLPVQPQPFGGLRTLTNTKFLHNHDEFSRHDRAQEEARVKERQMRDEEELLKSRILDAGLHHVPKLGWTRAALKAGTDDLGFPPTLSSIVLQPDIGLVHHQFKTANDQLESDMQKQVETAESRNESIKIGRFLRHNVEQRLRMNIPYMARWPEALALRAHPANAGQSLYFALQLVDSLWHFAGDKSIDMNWYSKRLSLLAIYKSTEVAMIQDKSDNYLDTWKFLDRRFEDHSALSSLLSNCNPADVERMFGGLASTLRIIVGLPRP